jgi:hypothetical protein
MTNKNVADWIDGWISKNKPEEKEDEDWQKLGKCLEKLKKLNGVQLLEHVTEVCTTKEDFNKSWTNDPNNVFGSSLYVGLRKWLGAGKR